MMSVQQATSKRADNWAPIILGAVLGMIVSGMLTVGISAWQVWRASVAVEGATTVPPPVMSSPTALTPGATLPGPGYSGYAPAADSASPPGVQLPANLYSSPSSPYGASATPVAVPTPYQPGATSATPPIAQPYVPVLNPPLLEKPAAEPAEEEEQAAEDSDSQEEAGEASEPSDE